jgi:predicted methyltransferase
MRLTEIAHNYLSAHLQPGDYAIDATAGNGHDTAHLASLVGPEGHVIAIDIQESAINATCERLKTQGCLKQVQPLTGEHSKILQALCSTHAQTISAITFNLGYLPGSDKRIQTTPETTLRALDASRQLLQPKGLLLVTAYRGHEGGQTEADFVAKWMHGIQDNGWSIKTHEPIVTGNNIPPILWAASRLSEGVSHKCS